MIHPLWIWGASECHVVSILPANATLVISLFLLSVEFDLWVQALQDWPGQLTGDRVHEGGKEKVGKVESQTR